jgi:hypothetical protein
MKKEATPERKGPITNTSDEKKGNPRTQGAHNKYLRWKNRQSENARGSKQRSPMKKEATLERKGLITKTSNKKRGNLRMEGAHNKDLWWKKRQPQNAWGS